MTTVEEVLAQLEALGTEAVRAQNAKIGVGTDQFGVRRGDIRALAKQIKKNHELGLQLWGAGNHEARMLAVLLVTPRRLSLEELDQMVGSATDEQAADWLSAYVVAKHPDAAALREQWMASDDSLAARIGWSMTARAVAKAPDEYNLTELLGRVEADMPGADPRTQWTMNSCLAEIGIHSPEHRERALAIGESLGLYRDYPVSKGCTSPYAPAWITEMVSRAS